MASILFLATGLLLGVPADGDAKAELAKLQGTWRIVAIEENGKSAPEEAVRSLKGTVIVEGDKHTLKYGERSQGTVTVAVNPEADPKHYDMTIPEGPQKGTIQRGIYELKDGTWKYCQDKGGKGRPTEFSGKAGSGWVLVVMKKVEP